MIKKIFFLSMAFLCLVANAQNALKGTVTDTDGTPLIGANIYLPNLNKGAISNTQGEYKIEELPKGKIKVLYSYIGYASQLKTLILEKKITQLNVTLATSSIQSQEVVVTGASTTSQHNSSEKIDVLSLSNKTAAPTTSFVATLTKIPGIDLIAKGEGVGKPVIRGLSRNDIVLLNDGVRIENYQFGDEHPLGI
ncbi:MAG: carboxypeptidase-like regulatory domain-containing protein, partial [Bacteroidaceae bacterium]|nr:carboxypeptidase-like regulatory domain-containing protein [Bacteroidaceae bacterium]